MTRSSGRGRQWSTSGALDAAHAAPAVPEAHDHGSPPDLSKPNVARVHDALLGGHDNFAADRELAGRLLEICPELGSAARENRAFIARAVDWAARQGIRQFADLGTGLPAHPSAAAAARASRPIRAARLRRQRSDRHRPRAGAAGDRRRGESQLRGGWVPAGRQARVTAENAPPAVVKGPLLGPA